MFNDIDAYGEEIDVDEEEIEPSILDPDTEIPGVHGQTFTPAKLAELAVGLTRQQVADSLGISYKTLLRREEAYPGLESYYANGKARGVVTVVNALYQNALKGNLGAQIFWLKNMAGWRDKHDIDTTNSHSYLIETAPKTESKEAWTQKFTPQHLAPITKQ